MFGQAVMMEDWESASEAAQNLRVLDVFDSDLRYVFNDFVLRCVLPWTSLRCSVPYISHNCSFSELS